MSEPTRRLPGGVFVFLAVALLLIGGAWWVRSTPPAAVPAASGPAPTGTVLTLRLDNGRVLMYERELPAVSGGAVTGAPCRRTSYRNVRTAERDSERRGGSLPGRARCDPPAPAGVSFGGRPSIGYPAVQPAGG